MQLSVIISTYNSPGWLEKVLYGYQQQDFKDFELIIADDGSEKTTFELLDTIKNQLDFPVIHLWHEHNGFRKTIILNKAIQAAHADYLVFSDGDCIPRADFLRTHFNKRKPGRFLSGGYFKLPLNISDKICKEDILSQRCFELPWLYDLGLKKTFKNNKLNSRGFKEWMLNSFTPSKATFNGHNTSVWKSDIISINGFDERMKYGGEDREAGERLVNKGIKGVQVRYSAICLHLDHSRNYINDADLAENKRIRSETRKNKITFTRYGIIKQFLL